MRDMYDIDSGLFYLEMTSRPREEKKHHSSLGEGLTIMMGFTAMMVLMFALA